MDGTRPRLICPRAVGPIDRIGQLMTSCKSQTTESKVKIEVTRHELKRIHDAIGKLNPKSKFPILNHVQFRRINNGIYVGATDLEHQMSGRVNCSIMDADDYHPLHLPYSDLRRLATGDAREVVTLASESTINGWITCMREPLLATVTLPYDPEMYPVMEESQMPMTACNVTAWLAAYNRVRPAVSDDPTRYTLSGVYHDAQLCRMVATSGRWMLIQHGVAGVGDTTHSYTWTNDEGKACEAFGSTIIAHHPILAGKALAGHGEIGIQNGRIEIRANGWTYRSKLIQGTCPNYQQVIPDPADFLVTTIEFGDLTTIKALATACGMKATGKDGGKSIEFYVYQGQVTALARTPNYDTIAVDVPATVDAAVGSDFATNGLYISFNYLHFMQLLAAGCTYFRIHNVTCAVVCKSPDGATVGLTMPMRLGPDNTNAINLLAARGTPIAPCLQPALVATA